MFLVNDAASLAKALELMRSADLLAFDTETTGLNVRKDKVIGFGVSTDVDGFYLPLHYWSAGALQRGYPEFLSSILAVLTTKKLLMFNASFDARMAESNFGIDLVPQLHCDVMLLKHTCDENYPFGLKEIASMVFGADSKAEKEAMQASIKANGGAKTDYYKADLETMSRYCVQDCLLTFKLYKHYSKELERQGLVQFYYNEEVLPLYKDVTIPMERAGVQLDVAALQQALKEINYDMQQLETTIQHAIMPQLELFTKWFLNKDYPYKETGRIGKMMKKKGILLEAAQMQAWAEDSEGYMFNLLSKHHLKKLFFDTLGETALSRTDPSPTYPNGQPQVDDDFLDAMAAKYPWAADLRVYNKLTKLKGTYIERLLEESEEGRFYPSFKQHGTVSGRFSGDMQQLPRPIEEGAAHPLVVKYTSLIRTFILPDTGSLLCSADYEQLEPSVFAHTSGDPALHAIFNTGLDFYSEVAIRTERLAGVSSDKSATNYLGKLDKVARQKAKAYALGIAYGMTGYKLQFEIGVSQEAAEQLVQDYLNAFPELHSWMNASKDAVRYSGRVKTLTGRVRHMPEAVRLHSMYGTRLLDSLQLWKDFNTNPAAYARAKEDRKRMINMLNNSINFKVQGLAASIVNRSCIKLARELKQAGLKSNIRLTVHDEIVLNVPLEEKEIVFTLTQNVMQNIMKLDVPLRTVPQFGNNFKECK